MTAIRRPGPVSSPSAAKKTTPVRKRAVERAPAPRRPVVRVRDKIFATACRLFYEHGIRAVGVDLIASEAGTNKMSFYRNFGSKEELVAEYLQAQERDYWRWWDATIAPYQGDPMRQAHALFDDYAHHASDKCQRGCALANVAVEISEDDVVIATLVRGFKDKIRKRMRAMAREMGARDPDELGDALMLLMEGGYYTRLAFCTENGPMSAASGAARALIRAYLPAARLRVAH